MTQRIKLSTRQRAAIGLLRRGAENGYDEGVVYADYSTLFDGQPWINWRTAEALQRRGLAVVTGVGEEAAVRLVENSS